MNAGCGISTRCRMQKRNAGCGSEMRGEMDAVHGNCEPRPRSNESRFVRYTGIELTARPLSVSRIRLLHSASGRISPLAPCAHPVFLFCILHRVEIPQPAFIPSLATLVPRGL